MTAQRADHCTHPLQSWCDCDWCRLNHHWMGGEWTVGPCIRCAETHTLINGLCWTCRRADPVPRPENTASTKGVRA